MIETYNYYVVQCSRRCTLVVALIGATCRTVRHSCLMKANWQRNPKKPGSVTLCIVPSWQHQEIRCCVCVRLSIHVVSLQSSCVVCVCVCVCACVNCVVWIAMHDSYAGY